MIDLQKSVIKIEMLLNAFCSVVENLGVDLESINMKVKNETQKYKSPTIALSALINSVNEDIALFKSGDYVIVPREPTQNMMIEAAQGETK